jgi:hypothetical protein
MPLDAQPDPGLDRCNRMRGHDQIPTPSGCRPRWHCLIATYGQNNLAERSLIADGWTTYWPLLFDTKHHRIGPLFGCYGFAQWSESDPWPRVYSVRGVFTVLSRDRHPLTVPIGVVEDLRNRTSPRGVVDDPGDGPVGRGIPRGARLNVVGGPWAGWEGVCTMSRNSRVRLLLQLFNRSVEVELPPSFVETAVSG